MGTLSSPAQTRELKLSILSPAKLCEAADLATAAFLDSPVYAFICDGDSATDTVSACSFRQRFLRWLFERNFRLRLGTSANRALYNDGGELIAFFMFVAPDTVDVGFSDMLRVGILMAPFFFGLGVVKRFLSIKADYERIEQEVILARSNERMFRLERMVVRPDMQGKGVGTHALKQALDEADDAGLPVMLATQEERNIRFYRRLGFEVVRTDDIAFNISSTMIRQPIPNQKSAVIDSLPRISDLAASS